MILMAEMLKLSGLQSQFCLSRRAMAVSSRFPDACTAPVLEHVLHAFRVGREHLLHARPERATRQRGAACQRVREPVVQSAVVPQRVEHAAQQGKRPWARASPLRPMSQDGPGQEHGDEAALQHSPGLGAPEGHPALECSARLGCYPHRRKPGEMKQAEASIRTCCNSSREIPGKSAPEMLGKVSVFPRCGSSDYSSGRLASSVLVGGDSAREKAIAIWGRHSGTQSIPRMLCVHECDPLDTPRLARSRLRHEPIDTLRGMDLRFQI